MENSLISWTHDTANLWIGCMKVHAGCDNCYAEAQDHRWGGNHWGANVSRKMVNKVWNDFKKFQKIAEQSGEIRRVFVGSMMDIFEKPYPVEDSKGNKIDGITTSDLRDRFFNDIVPNSPNLQFLLLTKRPGNIKKLIPESWLINPPKNVIYGYSVVDQPTSKEIDELVKVPGRHFLSMEPLLGFVDLTKWLWMPEVHGQNGLTPSGLIDWVIVGGESGHSARPMKPAWARSLRQQCLNAGVPFHFKQWGQFEPDGNDNMSRVQKKSHEAVLDGVEYKNFPVNI